jgi:hypothetical protein
MAQQQQLGHKDAALFRQVVRHFENKQYKKGRFHSSTLGAWLISENRPQSCGAGAAKEPTPC